MTMTATVGATAGMMTGAVEGMVVAALRKLPPDYLPEVLRYIEFLEYKVTTVRPDTAEDQILWAAVEANQEYKRRHPDEELQIFETGADFLKAMADL
ncbi:MAG: hypothetical protein CVU38_08715 [Chloroflexi bacterium HGW-Chloroflexi-1]|nr:MAG: hypothetical protein CVU38_08715 [Chloroflexi bacterium HGW-Chloroflexi-1]